LHKLAKKVVEDHCSSDRKFRYAGKEGLARKMFASFQLSGRIPIDNFYGRLKAAPQLDFLYPFQGVYINSKEDRYMKGKRQSTLEPVFGTLVQFMGYGKYIPSGRGRRTK
tara:strand:- start:5342 stop:5671 length:330 start_codon:yes stop_codon:yes gene_type:complete